MDTTVGKGWALGNKHWNIYQIGLFLKGQLGSNKQAVRLLIVHKQVAAPEAQSTGTCLSNMSNPDNLGHNDLSAVLLMGPDF